MNEMRMFLHCLMALSALLKIILHIRIRMPLLKKDFIKESTTVGILCQPFIPIVDVKDKSAFWVNIMVVVFYVTLFVVLLF